MNGCIVDEKDNGEEVQASNSDNLRSAVNTVVSVVGNTTGSGVIVSVGEAIVSGSEPILYRKLVDEEEIRVFRICPDSETLAHLIRLNPAIYSTLFGLGTHAFLDQVFKLWPEIRIDALSYFSIPAIGMGVLGWGIGAHSVVKPQSDIQTSSFKRTSVALLEGLGAVFPFTLGEEIEVYCANIDHLDTLGKCMVSEATFWGSFFPAPAVLSGSFVIWSIIPPTKKLAWASHGKAQKVLVITADSFFTTLLYSRIFQTLLMNISSIPQPLIYEYGAIPAAITVLAAQTLKPQHRQKLHTTIIYSMTANLIAYLVKFLIAEFAASKQEGEDYSWSAIFKAIAFPALFVTGFVYTLWKSARYVRESRQVERIVPAGSPRLLLQQQLDEALQRPEIRQQLVRQLLQDKHLKEDLMRDPLVKNALLQDEAVRQQLLREAGFEDVDLGINRLEPLPRNGSISLHDIEDGNNSFVSNGSNGIRGGNEVHTPPPPIVTETSPILTSYRQHQQRTLPSYATTAVVTGNQPSPSDDSPHSSAAIMPIGNGSLSSSQQKSASSDDVLASDRPSIAPEKPKMCLIM